MLLEENELEQHRLRIKLERKEQEIYEIHAVWGKKRQFWPGEFRTKEELLVGEIDQIKKDEIILKHDLQESRSEWK
ncbi:MAG: hypothetical protein OCC49_17990 [Fibrobacterales bacterium]